MNKKVFVVTGGAYSNYHILAVFSNREKAVELRKEYNEVDEEGNEVGTARVKEFQLDKPKENWCVTAVRMDREGNVDEVWQSLDTIKVGFHGFDDYKNLVWGVETRGEERAIKSVNEKRVIIKEKNMWGDTEKCEKLFGQDALW